MPLHVVNNHTKSCGTMRITIPEWVEK
jgi:hypothetical protein